MRVLSLDVDVFVDPVATWQSLTGRRRLDKRAHKLDAEDRIRDVLSRCGLGPELVPGVFIRDHDAAFDLLLDLARRHGPIDLLHVDAHADLGMGDGGWLYLLTDVAHRALSGRCNVERGGAHLNAGNWLAFATAAQCFNTILHVRREVPANDLMHLYFPDWPAHGTQSRSLRIVPMSRGEADRLVDDVDAVEHWQAIAGRPPAGSAGFDVLALDELAQQQPPDFAIVCQSPTFTVKAADRVLELCKGLVTIDAELQRRSTAPLGW